MRKIALAVLMFLLISMSGCLGISEDSPPNYETIMESVTNIVGLLLLMSLFLALPVYIMGNILMEEKMKAWAKAEVFEIIYSAILFVIIVTGVVAVDALLTSLTDVQGMTELHKPGGVVVDICAEDFGQYAESPYEGVSHCHIRLGIYYLHTIFTEVEDLAYNVYLSYMITSTLADFTMNFEVITEKAGMVQFNPWRGFFVLGNLIKTMIFENSIRIMMISKFQEVVLRLMEVGLFHVLLGFGVVLRSFTFTRKLGGLMMATALALYFIYPMFYAFGGLVFIKIKEDVWEKTREPDMPIAQYLYVENNVPVLWGDGTFNASREREEMEKLRRQTESGELLASDRMHEISQGNAFMATGQSQTFDFCKRDYDYGPVEVIDMASKTFEWFGEMSTHSWADAYVDRAFESGGFTDILARLSFFSLFSGLMAALGTIAAIKSLSPMLGGDVEIAGLTHLI